MTNLTPFRARRRRLPNRRPNETIGLIFEGSRYYVSIGYFADGRPGEVFCHGSKVGSGVALAHSMGQLGDGAPASIIGALAVLVAGAGGAPDETSAERKRPFDEEHPHD